MDAVLLLSAAVERSVKRAVSAFVFPQGATLCLDSRTGKGKDWDTSVVQEETLDWSPKCAHERNWCATSGVFSLTRHLLARPRRVSQRSNENFDAFLLLSSLLDWIFDPDTTKCLIPPDT